MSIKYQAFDDAIYQTDTNRRRNISTYDVDDSKSYECANNSP